ncbi:hypothetical protein [Pseudogulbenkiania subflava]|uniref:hypothetical protein n=1 Tax=Pseudogulbenkiania subflava TaxID=451637 RepID=UPI00190EA709|nr:hypothetical protein [Pseudogulbenkiania subflava]
MQAIGKLGWLVLWFNDFVLEVKGHSIAVPQRASKKEVFVNRDERETSEKRCHALRSSLLELHRVLIELERRHYEKRHGKHSAGEFLQVVAFSDEMRWLEPLSRLIVMLDEALEQGADSSMTPSVVTSRVRDLLGLDRTKSDVFSVHYIQHFDKSPELAAAHTEVLKLLKSNGS